MWEPTVSILLFKIASFLAGLLSWSLAQRVGGALGLFWFFVVRVRRRVVLENLARALPGHDIDHLGIARAAYRHFGISALEILKMSRMARDEVAKRVRLVGIEHFERACSRGRGVIVITAHFGNFDLLACSQAARQVPLAIVSRDLHGQGANRFWMETRLSIGLKIFPDRGAAKEILRWLKAGKVLGLTVDQRTPASRGGRLSPFMGWEVWTTTAPAALALSSGAAIVPVRVERGPDGYHDLRVEPEVLLSAERRTKAISLLTDEINAVVANWIYGRPDHWMWLHRRFAGARRNHELESCAPKG
jgi:KDO2-lipid IV(A) lauroyltransferase